MADERTNAADSPPMGTMMSAIGRKAVIPAFC